MAPGTSANTDGLRSGGSQKAAGASTRVERIDSLFNFEFPHGVGNPLLQVVFEPALYTIRKPDGFSLEQRGGRGPGSALKDSSSNCFQVATTHEIAQILNSVKLQVAVDVSGAELVPAGELFIDDQTCAKLPGRAETADIFNRLNRRVGDASMRAIRFLGR